MNIADQVVHSTGINWIGISPILAVMIAGIGVIIAVMNRRDERYQRQNIEIKEEISSSVNHLGEVLSARMETKEAVARISERLARVEGVVNGRREREIHL